MIRVLSTNITSPLGFTTEQNYQAVRSGCSALACYEHWKELPEALSASLFTPQQQAEMSAEGYSRFEALAIHSISEALTHTEIDCQSSRTILILSTTKGNVEMLEGEGKGYLTPGETARKIAKHFGLTTEPIVVSIACISGVSAQLLALRLIETNQYDTAIVCGADCQSAFTVTGFQSFKSLSPEPCRPFDIERVGLNLGEAASTIIYNKVEEDEAEEAWMLIRGCTNNDAYHISAPSPVGEGTLRAIRQTLHASDVNDLATVCVHGTATMFNDQMESKAIEQAGLSEVPLTAVKGYYGHTLGASGVLETIITLRALDDGIVLATKGFEEIGVSGKVNISNQERQTDKRSFLKIISGFGGCNGALLFRKTCATDNKQSTSNTSHSSACLADNTILSVKHHVELTTTELTVDGKKVETKSTGSALLTEIYKQYIGNYAKFYKMDKLCRLVFVATEMLIKNEDETRHCEDDECAIVLFNATSSIVSDRQHIATICNKDEFYPSPSVFVYTLPNIVTGEMAIKHQYKGETSLYILPEKNEILMEKIIAATVSQSNTKRLITGWMDCSDDESFEADLKLVEI